MSEPRETPRAALAQRLVVDLGAAFQNRATYASGHPELQRAVARVLGALAAWCDGTGAAEVSLLVLEGNLLVDREALPDDARWKRGLMRAFERLSIRGMTLVAGLDAAELEAFLDGCAGGGRPTPSRNLRLGQAGRAGEAADAGTGGAGAAGPGDGAPGNGTDAAGGAAARSGSAPVAPATDPPDGIEAAGAEWRALAGGTVTRIERLRALVGRLARGAEPLADAAIRRAATRVADRELVHGLSVALATLRLGRALGVEGTPLEELALAGLLHDVGHLDPAGEHQDPEWRRAHHAVLGAARLAALEGIPDVAVRVALEHHRRLDGADADPSRRPTPAVRLVAVA